MAAPAPTVESVEESIRDLAATLLKTREQLSKALPPERTAEAEAEIADIETQFQMAQARIDELTKEHQRRQHQFQTADKAISKCQPAEPSTAEAEPLTNRVATRVWHIMMADPTISDKMIRDLGPRFSELLDERLAALKPDTNTESDAEIESLREKIKELEEQREHDKKEIGDYLEQVVNIGVRAEQQEERAKTAERSLKISKESQLDYRQKATEAMKEVGCLRSDVAKRDQQIQGLEASAKVHDQLVLDIRAKAEAEAESSGQVKEALERELQTVEQQAGEQHRRLQDTLHENEGLELHARALGQDKEELEQQLETSRLEKQWLERELQIVRQQDGEQQRRLQDARQENESLEQQLETLLLEKQGLEWELQTVRQQDGEQQRRLQDTCQENEGLKQQSEAFRNESKSLEQQVRALRWEKTRLGQKLEAELQTVQRQHGEHQAQLQASRVENERLSEQLQTAQQQHGEHQAQLQASRVENERLSEQLQAVQRQHGDGRLQVQTLQDQQDRQRDEATATATALQAAARELERQSEGRAAEIKVLRQFASVLFDVELPGPEWGSLHALRPGSDRAISIAVDAAQDARWDWAETWGHDVEPEVVHRIRSRGVEHACADVLLRLGHGRVEASNVFEAALRVQTVVGRLSAEDRMDSGLCRALVLAITGAVRDAIGEPVEKGVSTRVTCPVLALPLFQIVAMIMKKWPQSCDSSDYVGVLRDDLSRVLDEKQTLLLDKIVNGWEGPFCDGLSHAAPVDDIDAAVVTMPGLRVLLLVGISTRELRWVRYNRVDWKKYPGGCFRLLDAFQPGDGEIVFLASVPLLVDLLNLGPESDSECEDESPAMDAEEAGE